MYIMMQSVTFTYPTERGHCDGKEKKGVKVLALHKFRTVTHPVTGRIKE